MERLRRERIPKRKDEIAGLFGRPNGPGKRTLNAVLASSHRIRAAAGKPPKTTPELEQWRGGKTAPSRPRPHVHASRTAPPGAAVPTAHWVPPATHAAPGPRRAGRPDRPVQGMSADPGPTRRWGPWAPVPKSAQRPRRINPATGVRACKCVQTRASGKGAGAGGYRPENRSFFHL